MYIFFHLCFLFIVSSPVNLESQEASVSYLPYLITAEEIVKQIGVAGFKASVKSKPRQVQLSSLDRLLNASPSTRRSPEGSTSEVAVDFTTSITTLIDVTGMHCNSCVVNIQDNIGKLPGVSSVQVSLEKGQALIQHNPNLVKTLELQRAVEALPPGKFKTQLSSRKPVSPASPSDQSLATSSSFLQPLDSVVQIHIEGMTCDSCVQTIESTISQRRGVKSAQVSLAIHEGTFEYDPLITSSEELRAAIEDMGFDAFLPGELLCSFLLFWFLRVLRIVVTKCLMQKDRFRAQCEYISCSVFSVQKNLIFTGLMPWIPANFALYIATFEFIYLHNCLDVLRCQEPVQFKSPWW